MRNTLRFFSTVLFILLILPGCAKAQTNTLNTGDSAPWSRDISINPPIELDNKTKVEVYNIRKSYVSQNRDLLENNYLPSEAVFGQIADKRPWWGIDGQFCLGNGQQSIEGVSEESRFISNPFILLALDEIQSWKVSGNCTPAYPKPVSLQWFAAGRQAKVTYALSEFYLQRRQDGFTRNAVEDSPLYLKNLNARDFGYQFAHLDPAHSPNIRRVNNAQMFADSVQLQGFLHCGGSCGYPGGCNNGSPGEPDLNFLVDRLPATLYCKLWKNKPASPQATADFTFIIELK